MDWIIGTYMLKKIKFPKVDRILLAIILLAVLIRVYGLTHGFPFIFHPDEPAVVRSALGIRFDPNPGHFDWPHLHFYLNFIVIFTFIKIRGLLQLISMDNFLSSLFPILWKDPLVFYLLSRFIDVLMGALTVIPVYLTAKKLFSREVALLSALVLTLIPYHVHTSHFALIDIPTTFWVAWAMYFSVMIFKSPSTKNYIFAGFFVGLAASTKYNGGLAAITVIVAHLLRVFYFKQEKLLSFVGIRDLIYSGVFALLGFVLGTPFSVFDFKTFIRTDGPTGALWQFTNVGKVSFSEQLIQFMESLSIQYPENFGYVFIAIYTVGLLYTIATKNKHRDIWLMYLPSLFMFFYISGFSKDRAHYYLSVYPFVAVVCGYYIYHITKSYKRNIKYFLIFLIFLPPLFLSYERSNLLYKKDTKVQMYEFLLANVKEGDSIYYTSNDFVPVMEKFSQNEVKKSFSKIQKTGYVLVGLDNTELPIYKNGLHPESYLDKKFEKVAEFYNTGRRGINIIIYRYEIY